MTLVASLAPASKGRNLLSDTSIDSVALSVRDASGLSAGGGALHPSGGFYRGEFEITATGVLTFTVEARRAGALRWKGTAERTITADVTITISMALFQATTMSCNASSAILTSDGRLWTWGCNLYGSLGNGTTVDSLVPILIGTGTYSKVACGVENTAMIDSQGYLWVMGHGYYGANGLGSSADATVPTQLGSDTWLDVAVGDLNMVGVKSDGSLWAWGWNAFYNLGDNGTTNRNAPERIDGSLSLQSGESFVRAAAGRDFGLAITNKGRLYGWGDNSYGQLGTGDTATKQTPVQIGTDTDWLSASCGYYHSLAEKSNHTLWGSGSNMNGQLGLGATYNVQSFSQLLSGASVSAFDAGDNFSFAIVGGALYGFGDNSDGQLGDGTVAARTTMTRIGSDSDWATVGCGQKETHAIKTDGTLWAWGRNDHGQAGQGSMTSVTSPVMIETAVSSMAARYSNLYCIRSDGSLWAAGTTTGLGDSSRYLYLTQTASSLLGTGQTWIQIAAGGDATILRRSDKALYVTGSGGNGQLGNGSTFGSYTFVPSASGSWNDVSAGVSHVVAIKNDGSLWTWGLNNHGQLGIGEAVSYSAHPSPLRVGSASNWVSAAAGDYSCVAVNSAGEVWTWGAAQYYALGNGDEDNDQVSPVQIDAPGTSLWSAVKAGAAGNTGWAIDSLGHLHAWGYGYYGQLGLGYWGSNQASPILLISGQTPSSVAGGFYHLLAVVGGQLFSAGNNRSGEGGDPVFGYQSTAFSRVGAKSDWTKVAAADSVSFALDSGGNLYGFGDNQSFALSAAAPGNVLVPKIVKF